MTEKDEIVAEVRAARDAWAASFNYDLKAMCLDLQRQDRENPESLSPLKPLKFELPEKTAK